MLKYFHSELGEEDVMVVDEVHERSVRIDVILGLINSVVGGGGCRTKFVMMSATVEMDEICRFFEDGGINVGRMCVSGCSYPVDVKYLKAKSADYIESAAEAVRKICSAEKDAGILVFLPGIEDIDEMYSRLVAALYFQQIKQIQQNDVAADKSTKLQSIPSIPPPEQSI